MDTTYHLNGGFKPTLKRYADLAGPDYFPTPSWATRALVDNEPFTGEIWEPACGDGAMARVLSETGCAIEASDLYDRGYGESGVDFPRQSRRVANIVTNPPYNSAEEFVHSGLAQCTHKLALLLRLAFLEGINRRRTIFAIRPPSRVWVFSERITFYPAGMARGGSGTTAYAWFVWDKQAEPGRSELRWLPTGYRSRDHAADSASEGRNPMLLK